MSPIKPSMPSFRLSAFCSRSCAAVLSVLLTAVIACTGNGGAANSNGDLYHPGFGEGGGGNTSNPDATTSGSSTGSFTAEDLLDAANAGDPGRIIELISAAPSGDESGETTTVVLSAAVLGLPAGGTVTLTISGAIRFDETKSAADDGTVTFIIPKVVTGKTVTLELSVKDETGFVIYYGKETGPVEGSGNLDITLHRRYRTRATADKTVLTATATSADLATITITGATETPQLTPSSALLNTDPPVQDASDPETYTVSVGIPGGTAPVWFADDTAVSVTVTVGSEEHTIAFTLKNKYTVEVEYTASSGSITSSELSTPYMQGSSITFAEASGVVASTQGNRGVAAFKYGSSTVLYKTAAAGATSVAINGTNFPGLASRTISLEAVLNLGNKASPDAVGDIVFSDGSASAYTESLNADQIAGAVAIIFDAAGKKGLGLNLGTGLKWTPGDPWDNDPTKSHNISFNTSDSDGSGNWAVIQARDPAGAAAPATWYRAFNYANTYSATGFTDGWYLPAKDELYSFLDNKSALEAAYSALGMTSPLTGNAAWASSSQYPTDAHSVYFLQWSTGNKGGLTKGSNFTVCAVRVFN